MSKQETLPNNTHRNSDVVELSNDWQQVGGALGNILGQLKVTSSKATQSQPAAPLRAMPRALGAQSIGVRHAHVDKAA